MVERKVKNDLNMIEEIVVILISDYTTKLGGREAAWPTDCSSGYIDFSSVWGWIVG